MQRNLNTDNKKQTAEEVKEKHRIKLMSIDGVLDVKVGKRDGSVCIIVCVAMSAEYLKEKLPEYLEGYPVVIEMTDQKGVL